MAALAFPEACLAEDLAEDLVGDLRDVVHAVQTGAGARIYTYTYTYTYMYMYEQTKPIRAEPFGIR